MELSLTELPNVIRNQNFGSLSNNIITEDGEVVIDVQVVPDKSDVGITITTTDSSITISGSYEEQFNDRGEYVSKGSSNKIEEPTVFTNIIDLPPNQDLYEYIQDPKPQEIITYSVTITYNQVAPLPIQTDLIYTTSFTHTILNDVTTGYNILKDYYWYKYLKCQV